MISVKTCDRCLSEFNQEEMLPVNFWLTPDQEMISEVNEDIIWFPDSKDWIDLSEILRELIYVAHPLKVICRNDCKGLCVSCGQNLNDQKCSCKHQDIDSRWNKLKNLQDPNS